MAGYLGNIKGAYGEYLVKKDIIGAVPEESRTILIDTKHVNKGGPDYSDIYNNVFSIAEAKSRQSLTMDDIKNYIKTDDNGAITGYNIEYSIKHLREAYFKDASIQKRFVLYLNGPKSQDIKNSLNLPTSLPYEYINPKTNERFSGTIDIVVMAVNK